MTQVKSDSGVSIVTVKQWHDSLVSTISAITLHTSSRSRARKHTIYRAVQPSSIHGFAHPSSSESSISPSTSSATSEDLETRRDTQNSRKILSNIDFPFQKRILKCFRKIIDKDIYVYIINSLFDTHSLSMLSLEPASASVSPVYRDPHVPIPTPDLSMLQTSDAETVENMLYILNSQLKNGDLIGACESFEEFKEQKFFELLGLSTLQQSIAATLGTIGQDSRVSPITQAFR